MRRRWLFVGVAVHVILVVVVVGIVTRGRWQHSPHVYCGPDGRLATTAPIQSHRSYCVRAFTPVKELEPGVPIDFSFDIVDDRGQTLKNFATVHEKIMHVIVVREDLTQFQHVHPTFSASDGRYTVERLALPEPGPYRLFADFTPAGGLLGPDGNPLPVTVPIDLAVGDPRRYEPVPLPPPLDSVRVGDYEVMLERPDTLRAGEARITFTIRRGGAPVTDLQPYLGANGHAVILREEDLAFIHSHALEDETDLRSGRLPFVVHFGEPGGYRMFVQFQHQGEVHTAAVTLPPVMASAAMGDAGHSGH